MVPIMKKREGKIEKKNIKGSSYSRQTAYKVYAAILEEKLRKEIEKKEMLPSSETGFNPFVTGADYSRHPRDDLCVRVPTIVGAKKSTVPVVSLDSIDPYWINSTKSIFWTRNKFLLFLLIDSGVFVRYKTGL